MTLQQLEYIVALDQHRHFVRAADSCRVSQSTLSTLVKKLEEELDTTIFDRNSHPVCPTPAGEKIIAQAKVILYNAGQLKELSLSERERRTGDVRLGIIPTVAPYLLPDLFCRIREASPGIRLNVSEMITENLIRALRRAEIDIAIAATPVAREDLLEIPLYYEHFIAYVSPKELIHGRDEIVLDRMPVRHLWVMKEGHCLRDQVLNICKKQSDYSTVYAAGNIDTLVRIIDRTDGYTLIPELHARLLTEEQRTHLRPLVNPEAVREISMIIRSDYVREGILNELADAVKHVIPEEMLDPRLKRFAIKI